MSFPLFNLGDLVDIKTGKLDANAAVRGGKYPFFTCAKNESKIDTYSFDCDAILIAGNGDLNIKHYAGKFDAYQRTYVLSAKNENNVHMPYLYYFLEKYVDKLRELSIGGVIKYIKLGMLTNAQIPLPVLSTQKKIASILEKADQLRRDCQQMEQELNNLAQAVFIDMFGDPVSNPKGWRKITIGEMVDSKDDIKCGPFGTQLSKSEFKQAGVPLWGIKNVNNGFRVAPHEFVSLEKAKNLDAYSIKNGDIVMTRKGNVGNCHIYPAHLEGGIMHSDLLRIRPSKSKVDSAFLQKQLIYSRDVEDQLRLISQGAIMAGINVTKLKSLTLIYPPIDLQKKFSNIISSIDAQLSALAIVQQEHQENFNSLMQKAFNGELKLKSKVA